MKTNRKTILNIAQSALVVCMIIFIIVMISRNSSVYVPMSDIDEAMRKATGISELMNKDDPAVKNAFGFVPSEYIYYRSDDIMDVRELFIARAADDNEMQQIQEAVRARISTQTENFTGYGTYQLAMIEQAIQIQKGDYYFYAVSDESDEWQQLFQDLI